MPTGPETLGGHQHDHGPDGQPPSDDLFSESFWDERYGSRPAIWSGNPNPQLVSEVANLEPGLALDAGCGEGADAIWLASQGWTVTAVDISTVALGRGRAHAEQVGDDVAARITWQQVDLRTWEPEPQTYDLVSAQFMQLPPPERSRFFNRLGAGVAHSGTLLIVGHSPSDLHTTAHRPPWPELFFTAGEIASILDPTLWSIDVNLSRPRETQDPYGGPVTVHDEVVAARRS